MTRDYTYQAQLSARQFAKTYGVCDKAEIAQIARQFEHDLRRNDELREMAMGIQ
jgi:hypothetical protein